MSGQIILACDDYGNFKEYIPKMVGHTGKGQRHLAITVFIYNSKDQILLQKRKHLIFNNIWDNTASTHQLHLEDHDETDEEATLRALVVEYQMKNIKLKNLGGFNYFTQNGKYCENEHCKLLIGEYNGKISLNPEVGYQYKWLDKNEFLKDLEKNPEKYTPWCKEAVKVLKENQFFT